MCQTKLYKINILATFLVAGTKHTTLGNLKMEQTPAWQRAQEGEAVPPVCREVGWSLRAEVTSSHQAPAPEDSSSYELLSGLTLL